MSEETDVLRRFPYSREDFEYKRRKNLRLRAKRFTDISDEFSNSTVFFLSRQMIESRLNPTVLNLLLFYFRTRNEINRRESPTVTIEIWCWLCGAVWRFSWISRPFFFRSIIFLLRILYILEIGKIYGYFFFFLQNILFLFCIPFCLYKILQLHHCIWWFLLMNGYIRSIQGFIKIGNYLPYKTFNIL